MSFDNSRFTFNPWNDYLGVVMQQGRVQLDSDWNEWLAEFARRIQAGTLDTLGPSGVPSTTPGAFQISQPTQDKSGTWHVTIGVGRIYVDGLLAENHGSAGLVQWDPALDEWAGAPQTPIDYTNQPYLPVPTPLPAPPSLILVYLDVWQRDVSYIEDPNLVDKAVGVDTTGRRQTVWQVKFVDVSNVPGGVTPATPDAAIAPWEELILPSPSLLTNGSVPSTSSGPCSLSPATGYTGLENQLYRVEIHQTGIAASGPTASGTQPPSGTATFKWSRENASVATSVLAISSATNSKGATASQLTVQSMGRDQVLGFSPGDWIEIIDDYLELDGQTGELHQIDSINSAAKTITLDSVLSTPGNFPLNSTGQTNPGRHTRIERWDQSGTVYESDGATVWIDLDADGATGDIPVPPPGTSLILENGITVAFDLGSSGKWNATTTYTPGQVVTQIVASKSDYYISMAANNLNQSPPNSAFWATASFQTGDFWTFAARAADGSVEPLTEAPPSGVYHHYSRLGIVNFAGTPTSTDCRQVFQSLANPAIHVTGVVFGDGVSLQNDGTFSIQDLESGIQVGCDAPVDPAVITQSQPAPQTQSAYAWNSATAYTPGQVVTNGGIYYVCLTPSTGQAPPNSAWAVAQFDCPICYVTVDLPAPTPPGGGFSPLTLSSTVSVASTTITWLPSSAAQAALLSQVSPGAPPLLARLKLKGNSIWADGNPNVFLNGATTGGVPAVLNGPPTQNLQLPTGDGRVSADFDMWFWLISQPLVTLSGLTGGALNFGTQVVGTPSAAQSVTLTNNGTDTLNITTPIAISGPNATQFTLTNLCGTTLAAGASCTINVTFAPSAPGTCTAQISIAESADVNPLVIALTGTAVQPQVSISPTSLTFPAQLVGTTSAPQIVTVTNTGSVPLTVSAPILSGGELGDFTQSSTCIPPISNGILSPGQQCQISVQFTPTATGLRSDQLLIGTSAEILSIVLTGTGTNPIKAKETDVKLIDRIKTTDFKVADAKVTDAKVTDAKVTDAKVTDAKLRELKVREGFRSAKESPAGGVAEAGSDEATRKAFISPEERPPVDPPGSGNPGDEPPKEGEKKE